MENNTLITLAETLIIPDITKTEFNWKAGGKNVP